MVPTIIDRVKVHPGPRVGPPPDRPDAAMPDDAPVGPAPVGPDPVGPASVGPALAGPAPVGPVSGAVGPAPVGPADAPDRPDAMPDDADDALVGLGPPASSHERTPTTMAPSTANEPPAGLQPYVRYMYNDESGGPLFWFSAQADPNNWFHLEPAWVGFHYARADGSHMRWWRNTLTLDAFEEVQPGDAPSEAAVM